MCTIHADVIDADETKYTVERLHRIKAEHEAKAAEPYVISDELAARIVAFMAGATIASGLGEFMREIVGVIKSVGEAVPTEKKEPSEKLLLELVDMLRYAPKGVVQHFAADPLHLEVAAFVSTVFRMSGWLDWGLMQARPGPMQPRRPELLLVFLLRDPHQISNAEKAIREVFARCGFMETHGSDESTYELGTDKRVRISIFFGVQR